MYAIAGFFNYESAPELTVKALEGMQGRGGRYMSITGHDWREQVSGAGDMKRTGKGQKYAMGHRLNFIHETESCVERLVSDCILYRPEGSYRTIDGEADRDNVNIFSIVSDVEPLDIQSLDERLSQVDGVYAFAYWRDGHVSIARDMIGIKPLWYSTANGFAFASEKKVLVSAGCTEIKELEPRNIISYDISNDSVRCHARKSFVLMPEHTGPLADIKADFITHLKKAVSIRLPDERFGVLFSGGLDSTVIAHICMLLGKEHGRDITCYTVGLKEVTPPPDVEHARWIADRLGLDLKVKLIDIGEVETHLRKVVPLVEDSSVPMVGVALVMYVACAAAREDGIRTMFSGSGADELLAGYDRHKRSVDINRDCLEDIMKIYAINTFRDDVVSMHNGIELRVPYLDQEFVEYSLRIPAELKIKDAQNKWILREAAKELGLPDELALRKKQAAQYGSRFDKAIGKLAKDSGASTKTEYLNNFKCEPRLKLGVLFSSGKDSIYAMHKMQEQHYPIACLITIKSKNPDSYMFHTPNIGLAKLQAEALGIPLIEEETAGEKETELEDMRKAILTAKREYGIEGIVSGALYSNYQRERIEKVCLELGLEVFSPLWHIDQEEEMRQLLLNGFEFILSSVAALGLDKSWVGRRIVEEDVDKLVMLNKKIGLNVAGEGGEFESFVLDAPMYRKRIVIKDMEIIELDEYTAKAIITNAVLVDKD